MRRIAHVLSPRRSPQLRQHLVVSSRLQNASPQLVCGHTPLPLCPLRGCPSPSPSPLLGHGVRGLPRAAHPQALLRRSTRISLAHARRRLALRAVASPPCIRLVGYGAVGCPYVYAAPRSPLLSSAVVHRRHKGAVQAMHRRERSKPLGAESRPPVANKHTFAPRTFAQRRSDGSHRLVK